MKIVFAGTPVFAERHLAALLETDHDVCAVYTQPDRPAGRGKKIHASPVKVLAQKHGIPVYQPVSLKHEDAQAQLAALNADLIIVVAYGLILPQVVLDMPKLGCLNVHGSILPRWRGAAPIQRAIEAGDTQTGVTIMQMDAGLDTGAMLHKAFCDITDKDSSATLHDKLCEIGPPALIHVMSLLEQGKAKPEVQDDALANYASKIDKHEALIDWRLNARALHQRIRAFNPFPICYSEMNGERFKVHAAQLNTDTQLAGLSPGELRAHDGRLVVGTGNGLLELLKVQLPGKKATSVTGYLNGLKGLGQSLPTTHFDVPPPSAITDETSTK